MHLAVGGGHRRGGNHCLRENRDCGGLHTGAAVGTGTRHRIGGGGGRRHRDALGSSPCAPQIRTVSKSSQRDGLAQADVRSDRVHTGHKRHNGIAVVDAIVHFEGAAQEGNHIGRAHFGLRDCNTVGGCRALGSGAQHIGIGIAVGEIAAVAGHTAIIGAVRVECACEIAVGEIAAFGIARHTGRIVSADIARGTQVLEIDGAVARIGGAADGTDVVAAGGVDALNADVDHQTASDIDTAAAAHITRDAAHHTAGLQDRVDQHQRVDGTGRLQRTEKTGVEGVSLVAVKVVDAMAVAIEVALEGVAGAR